MELTTIKATVGDDGLAELTLSRPDAGNAIDLAMARELHELTVEWSVDPNVRCILVRGEGKNFCVGGDVKSFVGRDDLPAHSPTSPPTCTPRADGWRRWTRRSGR